ncbi:MAG: FkbM family methyltransferase [Chlorobium sp.]|nr:MAG: FkbM family methyltransferase [Chlorobium sp.]
MQKLKNLILKAVNVTGYSISRNEYSRLYSVLDQFDIDMVLDIGANIGQFGSSLRHSGYKGKIVSFEPLEDAHTQLKKLSKKDKKWAAHPRVAVGDCDGKIEINIAGNSESSSILPMLKLHSDVEKGSEYIGKVLVNIVKLDSVAQQYIHNSKNPFLKIDTQGYEWAVLDGAKEILPRIKGILCELSLVELYEGQRLWMDMLNRLKNEGFTLWSIQRGFEDRISGRTLQIDATFFRL